MLSCVVYSVVTDFISVVVHSVYLQDTFIV